MKNVNCTLILGMLVVTSSLFANTEYSVTGKETSYNYPLSCSDAAYDAELKASRLCIKEGGTGSWYGGEFGRCREVYIPGGSKIKLSFFCVMPRNN